MSLSSETARIAYTVTTDPQSFAVPFVIINDTDIEVVATDEDGLDTTLTLNTHYTVTGEGTNPSTAQVVGIAGRVGETITIYRNAQLLQPSTFVPNGQFPSSTMGLSLDRAAMQTQQLKEELKRCLRVPVSNAEVTPFPLVTRKNKVVGFDSTGATDLIDPTSAIINYTNGSAIEAGNMVSLRAVPVTGLVTGQLAGLLGYHSRGDGGQGVFRYDSTSVLTDNLGTIIAPNAGSGRWIRVNSGTVHVRWFGAKGDSITDDTASFEGALDYAATDSKSVYVAPGTYIVSGLTIREDNMAFFGAGSAVTTIRQKAATSHASTLELGDLASGNSAAEYVGLHVSGLTIDGNKAAVTQPSSDLTGWGVSLTKFSHAFFSDLRCINCWNGGFGNFINSNYNIGTVYVENCGVGHTGGGGTTEPGFDINSSKYCRYNVVSKDCRDGFRLLDNCFGNVVDVVVQNATTTGVILSNQTVNESHSNVIRASVTGGCTGQGLAITTNFRNSQITIAVDGITGKGVNDIANGANGSQGNTFNVVSRLCGTNSCVIENSGNTWNVISVDDGTGGVPGDHFAVDVRSGAIRNLITANVTDTRGTVRIRGVIFQSGANNNQLVSAAFTTLYQNYTDNGTGNIWLSIPLSYTDVTFDAGWANGHGAPYATAAYLKDQFGKVTLKGTAGGSATGTMFTLPAGFRPSERLLYSLLSSSDGSQQSVEVNTDGTVVLTVGTHFTVNLNAISFFTL